MEKANSEINRNAACWYVVCTAPRAELKVKEQLDASGFESYLPFQSVVRVWENCKKSVMVPIMTRILFVRLSEADLLRVVALKRFSLLQSKEGGYVSVSSEELERVQSEGLETIFLQK